MPFGAVIVWEDEQVLLIGGKRGIEFADQLFGRLRRGVCGPHSASSRTNSRQSGRRTHGTEKVASAPDLGQMESFIAFGAIVFGLVEHGAFLRQEGKERLAARRARGRLGCC